MMLNIFDFNDEDAGYVKMLPPCQDRCPETPTNRKSIKSLINEYIIGIQQHYSILERFNQGSVNDFLSILNVRFNALKKKVSYLNTYSTVEFNLM